MAKKKYRVYISQVNRHVIEVVAESEEEASEKGYRKWRRDYAESTVDAVEEIKEEEKS